MDTDEGGVLALSDPFYKAFEDRHRGPRELITRRLQVYLPFVEQLKALDGACTAVDLGCGRGEWVELLVEHGVVARGVDLDENMLNECRERDLDVQYGDAIELLTRLPDESEAVVSGFHIAEHLPFPELKKLVAEAFRVLRPAGLLILETPNPENLVVGASTFYTDPTHVRPLPPDLLSFLAEHAGFARTKVLRLNQSSDAHGQGPDPASLKHVLTGVSPDYSIVAQKAAPEPTLRSFDALFDTQYGLTLDTLVTRYEESLNQKLDTIIAHQKTGRDTLENVEAEVAAARAISEHLELELAREREERDRIESELKEERGRLAHLLTELESVYASRSWRLTQPLRRLQDLLTWLGSNAMPTIAGLLRFPGRIGRWLLARSMEFVLGRPGLSERLNNQLMRYPNLHGRLVQFARRHSLHDGTRSSHPHGNQEPEQNASLNPHARRIYYQLLAAIRRKPGGER